MAIVRIYHDTRRPGVCRSCGARIEWADLLSGHQMPFDVPLAASSAQADLFGDERVIEQVDTSLSPSHFETCRDANRWRRRAPR
jgi:hypothetical protein